MNTYVHMRIHTYVPHMNTCCQYAHTKICTCTCTCIHTYIHAVILKRKRCLTHSFYIHINTFYIHINTVYIHIKTSTYTLIQSTYTSIQSTYTSIHLHTQQYSLHIHINTVCIHTNTDFQHAHTYTHICIHTYMQSSRSGRGVEPTPAHKSARGARWFKEHRQHVLFQLIGSDLLFDTQVQVSWHTAPLCMCTVSYICMYIYLCVFVFHV